MALKSRGSRLRVRMWSSVWFSCPKRFKAQWHSRGRWEAWRALAPAAPAPPDMGGMAAV